MSWLNFITLNSVAPLPNLHQLSDAGAGEGLMQLHPSRDTELIACGRACTPLNGELLPSPVLGNGSVTPAILVHGLFRALQKRGFKIRLHSYQLGLDNCPDLTDSLLDDVVIHQCQPGQEARLIEQNLIPELERQRDAGEEHIIAESGIGGTTYATVWLRLWLDKNLWFAGSTKDPGKLAVKRDTIAALIRESESLPLVAESFVSHTGLSDPVQRACCALLKSDLSQLNLAGGAMMFAPLIAMKGVCKVGRLAVATTRWVMQSADSCKAADALPENCQLYTPQTSFLDSAFDAIRMYERGYVVEGCGLGATLVFAEQHGINQDDILSSMDEAVARWL
jgi:hypothetical protein